MTPPEFGRPKNIQSAIDLLPRHYEREVIQVEPEERAFMLREFLEDFMENVKKSEDIHFGFRHIPVEIEAMRLLYNLNSFRRDLSSSKTYQWSYLGEGSYPWPIVCPSGENAYRWWQITTIDPEVKIGKYNLVCIETNLELDGNKDLRFGYLSDFDFVLATDEEILHLNNDLRIHNHDISFGT